MPTQPGGPDCEGVIHHVTTALLPEQAPFPRGDHTIELSWSRTRAVMRLRLTGCEHEACRASVEEWYVTAFVGKMRDVQSDPVTGRMRFRARCRVFWNAGHPTAQFRRPVNG
jgi:hypothetical protein